MSYSTPEKFRAWFEGSQDGATRLATWMQETSSDAREDRLQEALDSASSKMNGKFALAGYVVPIEPADSGDHEDENRARLELMCHRLAVLEFMVGLPQPLPDGFHTEQSAADQELDDYRGTAGFDSYGRLKQNLNPKASFPGLERAA